MSEYIKVGTKKDFPDNTGTGVIVKDRRICVIRAGEKFFALMDRCSHAESLLSGGDVEQGEISCPLHGARFSIETGEATSLPAVKPVPTYDVKLEGDNVFVKFTE